MIKQRISDMKKTYVQPSIELIKMEAIPLCIVSFSSVLEDEEMIDESSSVLSKYHNSFDEWEE